MKKRIQSSTSQNTCATPDNSNAGNFKGIVESYKEHCREHSKAVLDMYEKDIKTLDEAIEKAAFAKTLNDKRHGHQYRIQHQAMEEAQEKLFLIRNKLDEIKSFEELFYLIDSNLSPIRGIGELMVYDTALRLGAYLKVLPKKVYLHRGAKVGANYLSLGQGKRAIDKATLPQAFQELEAYEIEDCLCIFKDEIKAVLQN